MNKEFGVFKVNEARLIRQRVLGDTRSSMSGDSGDSSRHENEYYAVLTEDVDAATSPLDGFVETQVRILKYDDYAARSMVLAEGDNGLLTVIHRWEGVSGERGTLVTVKKIKEEWSISGIDCEASTALIAALDALD